MVVIYSIFLLPVIIVVGFLYLVWQGVLFVFDLLRELASRDARPVSSPHGHTRR